MYFAQLMLGPVGSGECYMDEMNGLGQFDRRGAAVRQRDIHGTPRTLSGNHQVQGDGKLLTSAAGMFKKLKDKIAEEVKISPQRMQQLQQFTQTVSERLQQGTTSASAGGPPDTGLFCITEDEGFTPVALHASAPEAAPPGGHVRRASSSSAASDASTMCSRLQADVELDVSGSDLEEDNASTRSSQLGHVSKEQLHAAFRRAQARYHKYRARFTDVASHCSELERDNAKLKALLAETQDKCFRRVSELKEQCALGQRAKADLEAALRTELEEQAIVVDTLRQKVALLQADAQLEAAEQRHLEEVERLRAGMRQSLGELQAKMCSEHATKEAAMRADFEAQLRQLAAGGEPVGLLQAQEALDALRARHDHLEQNYVRLLAEKAAALEEARASSACAEQMRARMRLMEADAARAASELEEAAASLAAATAEPAYLRNVLYNYMMGKEGVVLARVIAAVCKFDGAQTDAVLKHEQRKQTILGQLGIL